MKRAENEGGRACETRMESVKSEGGEEQKARMEGIENEGGRERKLRMEGGLTAGTLKTELTTELIQKLTAELTQGRRGQAVEIHRAVMGEYPGTPAPERMIIKAGIERVKQQEFWREVAEHYPGCGWNPRNIARTRPKEPAPKGLFDYSASRSIILSMSNPSSSEIVNQFLRGGLGVSV